MKTFSAITIADLQQHAVWEFAIDCEASAREESVLRPFRDLPIRDFGNRIVGTIGTLANGDQVWIVLGNIDLRNSYKTEHFLTLTVFNRHGKQFQLARYHDVAIGAYGPSQLAEFLDLSIDDIFPIAYDISNIAIGDCDCVRRKVPVAPRQRLSRSELIQ